jgi:hypothetical protein
VPEATPGRRSGCQPGRGGPGCAGAECYRELNEAAAGGRTRRALKNRGRGCVESGDGLTGLSWDTRRADPNRHRGRSPITVSFLSGMARCPFAGETRLTKQAAALDLAVQELFAANHRTLNWTLVVANPPPVGNSWQPASREKIVRRFLLLISIRGPRFAAARRLCWLWPALWVHGDSNS